MINLQPIKYEITKWGKKYIYIKTDPSQPELT